MPDSTSIRTFIKKFKYKKLDKKDHRKNWLNNSRLNCINRQKKFLQENLKIN